MTTPRSSFAVLRAGHRDVVLARPGAADPATIISDPTGVVAAAIRACAARDKRREGR